MEGGDGEWWRKHPLSRFTLAVAGLEICSGQTDLRMKKARLTG